MDEIIKDVYTMELDSGLRKFFFSTENPTNQLKYNYYLLSLFPGNRSMLVRANDILNYLSSKRFPLKKVDKDHDKDLFSLFMRELQNAGRVELEKEDESIAGNFYVR